MSSIRFRARKAASSLSLALTAGLMLGACSFVSEPGGSEPEPVPSEETSPKAETSEPPETVETELEPVRDGPELHRVGDLIERPTADLIIETLEERDVIATDHEADYEPREGERLWYVDITWTNNLPEVVSKECHGPYAMELHAFDLQGREMMMVEQPGYIEGQECGTGLMQGQTGRWQSAFHGLDEEFGWLVFDDFNGEEAVVVLDPDLELYYD